MNIKYVALVLVIGVSLSSCASVGNASAVRCVSVEDVIGQIDSLGREPEVAVCGVLSYRFEDKNLYASRSAARRHDTAKCIAVGYRATEGIDLSALDGRSVRVVGRVTSTFCPADAICAASCSNIGIFVSRADAMR
jgi:hypothetical protein